MNGEAREGALGYDGNGNLTTRFEYADGRMPYKMTQNAKTYYLGYDQVGTLRAVSKEDGTIVKRVEYDAFGNVLSDSNATLKVPFGFAGGLYDPDTKLTRFGYRDYDAETGKWTAKDPIGFNGGDTNLYGYVLQDPVDLVDPEGLFTFSTEPIYQVFINGPYNSFYGAFYAHLAWQATDILFSNRNPAIGAPNAFRHCYWSCMMAQTIGSQNALNIGALHEVCGDNDSLDMWNNAQGAYMQTDNCAQSCIDALDNGLLR